MDGGTDRTPRESHREHLAHLAHFLERRFHGPNHRKAWTGAPRHFSTLAEAISRTSHTSQIYTSEKGVLVQTPSPFFFGFSPEQDVKLLCTEMFVLLKRPDINTEDTR